MVSSTPVVVFAAWPPDVRKGSAFPFGLMLCNARLRLAREKLLINQAGRPEAFRTSGGRAAKIRPARLQQIFRIELCLDSLHSRSGRSKTSPGIQFSLDVC